MGGVGGRINPYISSSVCVPMDTIVGVRDFILFLFSLRKTSTTIGSLAVLNASTASS